MTVHFWLLSAFLLANPSNDSAKPVDYVKEIKPLLAERCYSCHGALQQKSRLRVDTAASLIEAEVVVPGQVERSPILKHLQAIDDHSRMPPEAEGELFSAEQIDLVRNWIEQGAKAPAAEEADPDPREHWAFRKPVKVSVPGESRHPVDGFLAQGWRDNGLSPQQPADKKLLLRRLTIDLTGLPPTQEEMAAFLADDSPEAYGKVVDRLLASPAYGERWGRHFLDIWRYSDWWGLGAEVRHSQKHLWRWRDWTVESLNQDVGYDQMIRLMLAGDELYPEQPERYRATGYLARQYFKFNRTTWLDEVIEHTGKGFLGLTFNCAKCHDHKYDPITQEDYYRFRAFFEPYQVRTDMMPGQLDFNADGLPRAFDCNLDEQTYIHRRGEERDPIKTRPITPGLPKLLSGEPLRIERVKLPTAAHAPHLRPELFETFLKPAQAESKLAEQSLRARWEAEKLKLLGSDAEYREAAKRAAKLEKELALERARMALTQAEADAKQAEGEKVEAAKKKLEAAKKAVADAEKGLENPGENYTPLRAANKAPESSSETEANRLKPFPAESTGRRTALANWIADPNNPLTARVLVNHVWARHFNQPLVDTVFDFGRKGTAPTHPELLDWLAVEFMEQGWSIKHLHRLIVTSEAYRMNSANRGQEKNLERDPDNRWLWRQNPTRMEAQAVRDSLLHLAGELDQTVGGPSIPTGAQQASKRRSLYFFHSHNENDKFLSQFDDANVLDCYRRSVSIVPQQALTLTNSKLALSAAEKIAARLSENGGEELEDAEFARQAFAVMLGTEATTQEVEFCLQAIAEWQEQNAAKPDQAQRKARINLILALINHNDFVTVR